MDVSPAEAIDLRPAGNAWTHEVLEHVGAVRFP
jgi:hypothetical protein